MTQTEAKELSIRVWSYLASHPECRSKEETPYWEELKELKSNCPLCEVCPCSSCPIGGGHCALHTAWLSGKKDAAKTILNRIKIWLP